MPIKKGNKVKLHLSGKLKDGRVFAITKAKEPLEFEAGAGEILPGIDDEVIGMEENEEKKITLSPGMGFGERKEELIKKVDKNVFKGEKAKIGQRINMQMEKGRTVSAEVIEIEADKITLDLNHPLAGKELMFKIKVVGIE